MAFTLSFTFIFVELVYFAYFHIYLFYVLYISVEIVLFFISAQTWNICIKYAISWNSFIKIPRINSFFSSVPKKTFSNQISLWIPSHVCLIFYPFHSNQSTFTPISASVLSTIKHFNTNIKIVRCFDSSLVNFDFNSTNEID